jgi:hypothetical protein
MKKVLVLILAGMLAACEDSRLYVDLPGLSLVGQTEDLPQSEVSREQFCRFSREAIGLPVLLNSKLRSEAYAALGKEKASELFRPLARANNSFRCICGTPEEKLKAKC